MKENDNFLFQALVLARELFMISLFFKDISFEIDGPCRNSRESLKGGGSEGSCDDAIGFWLSPRVPLGAGVSLRGDPTDGGPKYCVGLDVMNSLLWTPSSYWAS